MNNNIIIVIFYFVDQVSLMIKPIDVVVYKGC